MVSILLLLLSLILRPPLHLFLFPLVSTIEAWLHED